MEDEAAIEKALHIAFGPYRINSQREFFEIDELQAKILLDQFSTEDVTPQIQSESDTIDEQSKAASERLSSRRQNMNFEEMSITIGATLSAVRGDEIAVGLLAVHAPIPHRGGGKPRRSEVG